MELEGAQYLIFWRSKSSSIPHWMTTQNTHYECRKMQKNANNNKYRGERKLSLDKEKRVKEKCEKERIFSIFSLCVCQTEDTVLTAEYSAFMIFLSYVCTLCVVTEIRLLWPIDRECEILCFFSYKWVWSQTYIVKVTQLNMDSIFIFSYFSSYFDHCRIGITNP